MSYFFVHIPPLQALSKPSDCPTHHPLPPMRCIGNPLNGGEQKYGIRIARNQLSTSQAEKNWGSGNPI